MFVQCSPVLHHVFLIAIWFQWSLKRYLDVNCSKNAEPPCNKIDMQGHFRAFKPSWSKALGRWVFAGAIRDFVVRKVFSYNPTLSVLRGCRHQSCVCSFSVEFSGSSLHSHPWKPLGPWFSSGWARQTDLQVKKAEPLLVKTCFWQFFASTKGVTITNQETSLESWGVNVSLPRCLKNKMMSRQMRKMNCSGQV